MLSNYQDAKERTFNKNSKNLVFCLLLLSPYSIGGKTVQIKRKLNFDDSYRLKKKTSQSLV